MAVEFKVGDIVRLKSGGPEMTVRDKYDDGDLKCQWFAGKKLEQGIFPTESVEAATAKPPLSPSGSTK